LQSSFLLSISINISHNIKRLYMINQLNMRFILQTNPCKHPIIFMRDVEFEHLQSLLEFMYAGEVNISQAELPTFLRTAESLQIRGLTDSQSNQHNNEKVCSG